MSATGDANRPPRFLRWANARLTQGLERRRAPSFIRLLTVQGRVTGEPHATPVVPVVYSAARRLMATAERPSLIARVTPNPIYL